MYTSAGLVTLMPTPYHLDAEGYVYSESGARLCRVAGPGVITLWDKRDHCECVLTVKDIVELGNQWAEERTKRKPETKQ